MSDNIPTRIVAGDSVSFRVDTADYLATAGWAGAARLVGAGVALTLSVAAEDSGYRVTATAAQTAALTVSSARGVPCSLFVTVAKASERVTVYSAPCLLLPNPATITGDQRGHAAATLAAIEALLEGRATQDQQSYRIGDRELSRIPIPELLALRDYYRTEATREANAALVASGMAARPRTVLARMVRS